MSKMRHPQISFSVSVLAHILLLVILPTHLIFESDKINFAHDKGKSSLVTELQIKHFYTEKRQVIAKNRPKTKKKLKPMPLVKPIIQKASKGKTTSGQNTILAKYLSEIREKIFLFQFKNRLAQRLRLTGKVKLQFVLLWPNKIENIKLIFPSEYQALNSSAEESLRRVEGLPIIPTELERKEIPITLSMVYL